MNLGATATLPIAAERGVWYHAVPPQHFATALHTFVKENRFNPGSIIASPFEILYLAENPLVAQFEVEALFGSPLTPGGVVANPAKPWAIVNIDVSLTAVVDLTSVNECQRLLETTAQELTGDWRGYSQRNNPSAKIKEPTGLAPTQMLGRMLYEGGRCEGFRTISAKLPYYEVLAIFPHRLLPGSLVQYKYTDTSDQLHQVTLVP